MRKIVLNLTIVAAVAGWVVAFLTLSESNDLEQRLTVAEAGFTEASERLTDTQSQLARQQNAAGMLKDFDARLAVTQAEAAALAEEIAAKKRALETLRLELDSGKIELGTVTERIVESKAVLSRLTQDREGAMAELSRLRAETERQRETAIAPPAETQTAVQTPQATAAPVAAAATAVADNLADARRRFARIDQDGDGRVDRLDFRLKRVSLFGLVDANEDGFLTLDETLLSPEAFREFDSDGDGRISSPELADRRSFSVMDSDRDEFVTFEEYVNFLSIGAE